MHTHKKLLLLLPSLDRLKVKTAFDPLKLSNYRYSFQLM